MKKKLKSYSLFVCLIRTHALVSFLRNSVFRLRLIGEFDILKIIQKALVYLLLLVKFVQRLASC